MRVRRLISVLMVSFVATATVVVAQPKKDDKKAKPAAKADPKKPVAPAKGSGAGSAAAPAPGSGSGAGSAAGSAVEMPEDPPPKDIEGKDENPDKPKAVGVEVEVVAPPPATKVMKKAAYPVEEVMRPITLPANMSEVGIGPHFQAKPYAGADALRARYGITPKVQLGLTYLFAGIYDDPATPAMVSDKIGIHSGKAVGLDVTILLQNWIGLRVGVPFYINPVAFSLQLGAPMKFTFGDKFAIGGFDDLLNIKLKRFAPTFYQEVQNATFANNNMTNSVESNGAFRISTFGEYQYSEKTAVIARFGLNVDDFSANKTDSGGGGITTFMRAGFQFSPRKYLDLGVSLGFDDLADAGSFGPAFLFNLRI